LEPEQIKFLQQRFAPLSLMSKIASNGVTLATNLPKAKVIKALFLLKILHIYFFMLKFIYIKTINIFDV